MMLVISISFCVISQLKVNVYKQAFNDFNNLTNLIEDVIESNYLSRKANIMSFNN